MVCPRCGSIDHVESDHDALLNQQENQLLWPPPYGSRGQRRNCFISNGRQHEMRIAEDRYGQKITACIRCGERPEGERPSDRNRR